MKRILLFIFFINICFGDVQEDCCKINYKVLVDTQHATYSRIFSDIHNKCTSEALDNLKEKIKNYPSYSCSEQLIYEINSRLSCTLAAPGNHQVVILGGLM